MVEARVVVGESVMMFSLAAQRNAGRRRRRSPAPVFFPIPVELMSVSAVFRTFSKFCAEMKVFFVLGWTAFHEADCRHENITNTSFSTHT